MSPDEPVQAPDSPADPPESGPGEQKAAAGSDDTDPPAPGPDGGELGEDEDYAQTATVINNFYAEVAAHTVGVDGGHEPFTKSAIRRGSGMLAVAEVREALRYYVEPPSFRQTLKVLKSHHLVAVAGPEGCGKKAGSLALARAVCPDAESFTVFPPTRSLQELSAYKGYRSGQVFLIHDWVPVSSDSGSVANWDLQQLTARLIKSGAYLAISFEGAGRLQALFGDMYIRWWAPEPAALLDICAARLSSLQPSDDEWKLLRARAEDIRSPRRIIKLAEAAAKNVTSALAEASETENGAVAAWFSAMPSRWQIRAVTALAFLSGIGERKFERLQATLVAPQLPASTQLPDGEYREIPGDNDPFPQSRWKLANDASLGEFLSERDPSAPVGSEHRPAFCTEACRQHFMMELNCRFGEELWTPVRDWLFDLAEQPFGEAQLAAGYGLALLARSALSEVEVTYLRTWSAGLLQHRLMAVSVLWAMAEDERMAPAALRIAVSWVRNQGQNRAIAAAVALGGPLGQRHPSEAMRWLWALSQRGERVGRVARTAMSQLFTAESEADVKKSTVIRFLLQKVRPLLGPDQTAQKEGAVRQRRAALAVVNSVLAATQALSDVPVMVTVLRRRPADLQRVGELWAAVLNSAPHRQDAVHALYRTLATLTDDGDSLDLARRLGSAILPRLTIRTIQVLHLALPDPQRAEEISASIVAAFLGAHSQARGAIT